MANCLRRFRALFGLAIGLIILASSPVIPLRAQVASTATPLRLSLGEAARLAAQRSAAVAQARSQVEEYTARAREQRAALLPSLTATAADGQHTFNSASFGLPLEGLDPNGSIIGPVRDIDFRGRITANVIDPASTARYHSAQASVGGTEARVSVIENRSAEIAARAYVDALTAEAQVRAQSEDSSLAVDLLNIANTQLEAGVGVRLDVTRAKTQLARVNAQLIDSRNGRDRSKIVLLRALNLPLNTPLVLVDSLEPLSSNANVASSEADIAQHSSHPLVLAAQQARVIAKQELAAVKSERLPMVGLFGDAGFTSNSYSHLLNTYSFGLQVSMPLFNGFRTSARIAERMAILHQSEIKEQEVEALVAANLKLAELDLSAAAARVKALSDRLDLAQQVLSEARERFKAGVAGNADVISAQLDLNSARSEYINSVSAFQLARVTVASAKDNIMALP